jgi:hypothetical protein
MSNRPLTTIALVGLILAACETSTSLDGSVVAGRWATEREGLSPSGSYQSFLTFDDAAFTAEVRSYGVYEGQRPNDLSAYARTEGTFRIEGDRLHFSPTRLITWDHFYGPTSPERVESPYPWGSIFDDARFTVRLNQLTLHYITYPAYAPVATSRSYLRE